MKYIRTMTQQKLSFWLALYVDWLMNIAVLFRRFDGYAQEFTFRKGPSGVAELTVTVFATFFLSRLLSPPGRRIWRILAMLIVLLSAAASYYVTLPNAAIDYGIIASVMIIDIDLSKEIIGWHLIPWLVVVSAPSLLSIRSNRCRHTLPCQPCTPGQRVKNVLIVVPARLIVWGPIRLFELRQHDVERHSEADMPSYGGVIANSYLPSNQLSALGLYARAQVDESSDNKSLISPVKKFTYVASEGLDDTYVVFVTGETTCWDHMGILDYSHNTMPELEKGKNPVVFRGHSCDTATKLSLRCMFVRQGGAEDNPQRTPKEQNAFVILHQLGFSGNLYAMQNKMWFYNNMMANNIAYREQAGAGPRNRGKSVDDMSLVDEMKCGMAQGNASGKRLTILHTESSRFNYTQCYSRSFVQWKSECVGVDNKCSKAKPINSYDNSVTYVDHSIVSTLDQLWGKKAIVFYAADHRESINEREHLHGTPREMAPPEQFHAPMMVWMSDKYLENSDHAAAFAHLQQRAAMRVSCRHVELYDTIMGCFGYTSPDGGISKSNNWCRWKK